MNEGYSFKVSLILTQLVLIRFHINDVAYQVVTDAFLIPDRIAFATAAINRKRT